jgi:hypothetical protein
MTHKDHSTVSDILAWAQNEIARGRILDTEVIPIVADMITEYARQSNPTVKDMDVSIR